MHMYAVCPLMCVLHAMVKDVYVYVYVYVDVDVYVYVYVCVYV